MRLSVIALVLLTGCSEAYDHRQLLNSYAFYAADKTQVANYLEAEALESALRSIELLEELDLHQNGYAKFENVESHGRSVVAACLDVTEVSFEDSTGREIELENRASRQKVTVWINAESQKISSLEVGGPC